MAKPPAFPCYAQDLLVGAALMSNDEFGIYMRLLCYQWTHEGLPSDQKGLKALVFSRRDIPIVVLGKFKVCEDGKLRNERMELERQKQVDFRGKQRQNGNLGGRPKLSQSIPKNNPTVNPNETPQDEDEDADDSFCNREGIAKGMRTDGFPDAWRDWKAYRAEGNHGALTSYTARGVLVGLEKLGAEKAVEAIRLAIRKSWKNIFEERELNHGKPNENRGGNSGQSERAKNAADCEREGIVLRTVRAGEGKKVEQLGSSQAPSQLQGPD